MKIKLLSFCLFFALSLSLQAQVGVGVTTPHTSAAFEVKATNNDKGILIPRLTKTQRDAISSPATSLMIYQTDNTPGFYYYSGSAWIAIGGDGLGNHVASQNIDLNNNIITDNTTASNPLIIESLIDNKDISIKSYDEIFITTVDGSGSNDPNGDPYSTNGDIELTSSDDIFMTADTMVKIIANGDTDDTSILLDADQDIVLESDDDISLTSGDDLIINSGGGSNLTLNSDNDIELKVTSGDFVEIWEDGDFLYTLPGSRGSVGQFIQRSSDGSSEYFSDWSDYALPTSDGSNGQVLTTDGSGAVSWSTPSSGGASSLDDLSDVILYNTDNLTIGHANTGSLNDAKWNTAVGIGAFESVTRGDKNTVLGFEAANKTSTGTHNNAFGYQALYSNTSGLYNVSIGTSSQFSLTSGSSNIAIGQAAGFRLTKSNHGIFIGNSAGSGTSPYTSLGQYNIYIGSSSLPSADDVGGEIVIGANATGQGSNTITLGHTTNTDVYARGTVYSDGAALTSDARLKKDIKSLSYGLETIKALQPKSYLKRRNFSTDAYTIKEFGFIAQEVQKLIPSIVTEGKDTNKTLSLDYNSLIPVLTKAIQEQQALIERLEARIDVLENN